MYERYDLYSVIYDARANWKEKVNEKIFNFYFMCVGI
jgi:aminoglycoside/choline kinase family phosphotransferase